VSRFILDTYQENRRPQAQNAPTHPPWGRLPRQVDIERKTLKLPGEHRIMTVATLRPDGWRYAMTVGWVNEGLTLYFLCGLGSQKAKRCPARTRYGCSA